MSSVQNLRSLRRRRLLLLVVSFRRMEVSLAGAAHAYVALTHSCRYRPLSGTVIVATAEALLLFDLALSIHLEPMDSSLVII